MNGNTMWKKLLADLWFVGLFICNNFIDEFTKNKSMCKKFYLFYFISIFIDKYNILSIEKQKQYVIPLMIFFLLVNPCNPGPSPLAGSTLDPSLIIMLGWPQLLQLINLQTKTNFYFPTRTIRIRYDCR
jgi:hypothetical protein